MPEHDLTAAIRFLLDRERAAHLARDAGLLVSLFSDDFINVNNGRITRPTRAESMSRFQAYFAESEFLAWDDLEPPVIRVSRDGSMAHAIVRKLVRRIATDSQGQRREHETVFAWMEAWEREGDRWLLKAIASTNGPEAGEAA